MTRKYAISRGVLRADLDGEEVMLNVDTGAYHLLNQTGKELMERLGQGLTLEEAINRLVAATGRDRDQIAIDVNAFVSAMADRGLLEEVVEEV